MSPLDPSLWRQKTLPAYNAKVFQFDALYEGAHPLTADDIAGVVCWIASLPPHVNVNRLELMPVSQSWAGFQVHHEPHA